MTTRELAALLELPAEEKLDLAQALVDSVESSEPQLLLTVDQQLELERRVEDYRRNPEACSPLDEVMERVLRLCP
ncbi:MAG: addiction module protein [Acidobacteriota bacterium]